MPSGTLHNKLPVNQIPWTGEFGGLIDLVIFGVLRGTQTKWILNVVIGLVYAVIYYLVFKWAIVKFNIKTPGREDEADEVSYEEEVKTGLLPFPGLK